MIGRQSLGWAALAAVVIGSAVLLLFWELHGIRLDCIADGFGESALTALLVAAFAAFLAGTEGASGAFAWQTGPGKAAVIGSILLAAGAVVFVGLMYLDWIISTWGA